MAVRAFLLSRFSFPRPIQTQITPRANRCAGGW